MDRRTQGFDRFLEAQDPVFDQVRAELTAACKCSHWMWFIFPQLKGLGRTETAKFYGIESRAEALAYWQHPVLGARLKQCAELVLAAPSGLTAHDVFGTPDDMKLRSCMTLFAAVVTQEPLFSDVLERFHDREPDEVTLAMLR
jgi:uncharacterized protein (DUF1810 family)